MLDFLRRERRQDQNRQKAESKSIRLRQSQEEPQGDAQTPLEPVFPEPQEAQEIHDQALLDHGQPQAHLINPGGLDGALGRAANYWYYGQGSSAEKMADAAAALAHGVGAAQAFEDGNKRTAYHTARYFLHNNGYGYLSPVDYDDEELADHLIGHGEGTHSLEDTQALLRSRIQPNERTSNILDQIHDDLDPRVWDDPASPEPKLRKEHREFIYEKIWTTLEAHGYDSMEKWLSLVFTGSLTTYQYSDESDVDISLFVDTLHFPDWSRAEMIGIMVDDCDGTTLPGTPFPLQCFVVPPGITREDLYKPGMRSGYELATDTWIVPPDKSRVHDVEHEMNEAYTIALENADKMERLLRYEPDKAIQFWHQIHKRRQRDMKAGRGDYAPSNITYKMLANRGLFPQLSEVSGEYIAHHGSLHDNSDIEGHTSQPLGAKPQGHEKSSQWKILSGLDPDDEMSKTKASDHSHSVHTDRLAPSSRSEFSDASSLPERASSSLDDEHSERDHTAQLWTFDKPFDNPYTDSGSHPWKPSDDGTPKEASVDDTGDLNNISHPLNVRKSENSQHMMYHVAPQSSRSSIQAQGLLTRDSTGSSYAQEWNEDGGEDPEGVWLYHHYPYEEEQYGPNEDVYAVDVSGLPLQDGWSDGTTQTSYLPAAIPPSRVNLLPDNLHYYRNGGQSYAGSFPQISDASGEYIAKLAEHDYRMQHEAPGPEEGGPFYEIEVTNPDFYAHPEYYATHDPRHDNESITKLQQARGKPNLPVTIYRAGPTDQINPGDWVTQSRSYAIDHAKHPTDPSQDMPVWRQRVPASTLYTAGDSIHEWGYHGPALRGINATPKSPAPKLDPLAEDYESSFNRMMRYDREERERRERGEDILSNIKDPPELSL